MMIGRLNAAVASVALLLSAGQAAAASYAFEVFYYGEGAVVLAGDDDPMAVTLQNGDSFTYVLMAAGTGEWEKISSASIFPQFSLFGPFFETSQTFTLDLLNNGSVVFSFSEQAFNCCGHLGTNTVTIPLGLVFDTWSLAVEIETTGATGPAQSLLPWPGQAPEIYKPNDLVYRADVGGVIPEPATWAMMIAGFGLVGGALRRRRTAAVA
jgi:hypothetical protein